MQCNFQVKFFALVAGILLFSVVIPGYADDTSSNVTADLAQGAKDWANNCSRCHNLRSPTEFTPDQWHLIMKHMRIQGGLTGQEARNVSAFLMSQSAVTQAPPASAETANAPVESATTPAVNASATNPKAPPQKQSAAGASSGQSGSAVYHQTCIACHGANGKGAIPGAPDFTSKTGPLSKSDAILLQHIENGYQSPGSPMAMPPRGGNPKLTNADLKNALDYIRSTFGGK
jgi:cytochrome c5